MKSKYYNCTQISKYNVDIICIKILTVAYHVLSEFSSMTILFYFIHYVMEIINNFQNLPCYLKININLYEKLYIHQLEHVS
jgi:hypothetical protein